MTITCIFQFDNAVAAILEFVVPANDNNAFLIRKRFGGRVVV